MSSSVTTPPVLPQARRWCGTGYISQHLISSHESNCFFFLPISYRPTILWANEFPAGLSHLAGWSDAWLLDAAGADDIAGWFPLSWGGATPHFGSASNGSTTWTAPSLMPTAIWLGSNGCAATTIGYTLPPLYATRANSNKLFTWNKTTKTLVWN
jgi:hypothetical protein